MRLFVEVHAPPRVTQRFELPPHAVRLGSAPDCALRLDGQPGELLTIDTRSEGAFVRLTSAEAPPLVTDGVASREALIPWGMDAFVSGIRLSFLAEDEPKRGTSPWLLLALVAAVVWLGWQGARAHAEPREHAAPSVTFQSVVTTCPDTDTVGASEAARSAEHAALAREQRYPFDRAEGLKATRGFRLAEACFERAGDPFAQRRAAARREALEQRLVSDEVALRLRLESAVAQNRWQDARLALRQLERLVAPMGPTNYRSWLGSTLRWIDARSSAR